MRRKLSLFVLVLLLAPGCASEDPVLERGWIGGVYSTFPRQSLLGPLGPGCFERLPETLARDRSAAVIVTTAFESTPAYAAGIREGDLVFEAGAQPVESAADFLERVDAMPPGSKLKLKLYRFGETLESEVIVGRERYTIGHWFSLKLFPFLTCDLFPNPDFDVFGLLSFWTGDARLELRLPRQRAAAAEGGTARTGDRWGFWIGIFGLAAYRDILSQEPVEASNLSASRSHGFDAPYLATMSPSG